MKSTRLIQITTDPAYRWEPAELALPKRLSTSMSASLWLPMVGAAGSYQTLNK